MKMLIFRRVPQNGSDNAKQGSPIQSSNSKPTTFDETSIHNRLNADDFTVLWTEQLPTSTSADVGQGMSPANYA